MESDQIRMDVPRNLKAPQRLFSASNCQCHWQCTLFSCDVLPGADNASAACLATEKVVAVLEYVPYKMRAADLHAVRFHQATAN